MASGALDDDVAALSAWLGELERLAGKDGEQANTSGFARALPPELSGPLGRYARQLRVFHAAQVKALVRGLPLQRLSKIVERIESLRQRCVEIQRAHERYRIVPERRSDEESLVDMARLCRIEFGIAVSDASVEAIVLGHELGAPGDRTRLLEEAEHRRAARLHLQRLDVISHSAGAGEEAAKAALERAQWLEVAETGVPLPPPELEPELVARQWIDKSADLVVLYTMVLEKGTTEPVRWIGKPRRRQDEEHWPAWFQGLERLAENSHLFVAGSTHPGEEAALIAAFDEARGRRREFTLVLAPRLWDVRREDGRVHGAAVCHEAERLGRVCRLSELGESRRVDAVVIDCVGMLRAIYGIGQGAFVAGSLLAAAGHNFCEPLVFGVPTWTGPNHHANRHEFEEARRALSPHLRIVELDGLTDMMKQWIEWVDSGRIERERQDVQQTQMRYLKSLADQSVHEVRAVPRSVWECATRFSNPECSRCHGVREHCQHLADFERFQMRGSTELRWFVPAFARFMLERLDAQSARSTSSA